MRTTTEGISLIQASEGCRLSAYLDTSGIPTIGYGSIYITANGKLRRVVMGDALTQAQADEMFMSEISEREAQLTPLLKVAVSDNQFSALMDFLFQFGCDNLASSTILKLINTEPVDTISFEIITTIKNYIVRAEHTGAAEVAKFLSDWATVKIPADSIAYQFLRWVHGAHGEVVYGILVRQMKNIILYNE